MLGMLLSGPGLAGIAIAFALAFGGIQTYRLKGCQADAAAQKAQIVVMVAQIDEQNRAVDGLKAEGARRQAKSAAALTKAEERARVWDEQAARLASALTGRKPDGPKDCGAAWEAIRKQ